MHDWKILDPRGLELDDTQVRGIYLSGQGIFTSSRRQSAWASISVTPPRLPSARNNTLGRLGEIGVPTLLLQGRDDTGRTVAQGAEMRTRIAAARLEVLASSGHTPQLEEPVAFHRLALPFLVSGH